MEKGKKISKVVLVNQSTGYLMVDIVNAYCEVYDEVTLIAGSVVEYDRKLSAKVKRRAIIEYNKKTVLKRVITWVIGAIQVFFILLLKHRNAMVVYFTNPPLSYFASLFLKNKFVVVEYDIYPDALKNVHIQPKNFIYKIWARINRKVFDKAECVITLSEGMADLLSQYVNKKKIHVVPNWGAMESLAPVNHSDNEFIKKHRLEGKFVIMYSGNIGYTHNVEVILELARLLRNLDDVHFMIIGDGGKKLLLMDYAKQARLDNCTFLDWQPVDKINLSLGAADLAVVTLTEETAWVSVPSKTYNLLSVGSPLLCIAPSQSEIALLVEKEKCGRCFAKDEVENMLAYILQLKNDQEYRNRLSENALIAASHYTYRNAGKYVYK